MSFKKSTLKLLNSVFMYSIKNFYEIFFIYSFVKLYGKL